jgi:acyl carrier protein
MFVHEIHDLTNEKVLALLKAGLSKISDQNIIKNYHPDFSDLPGNLFYILKEGRYAQGKGTYYVIEDNDEYVGSAGWNEYDDDVNIAFALTRMYTNPDHRGQYLIAENILSKTLEETKSYNKVWLTINEHNKILYTWFVRASQGKSTGLFNNWPEVYKKFKPLGQRHIYNTTQYVVELTRNQMTDQEKLDFIKQAIKTLFNKQTRDEIKPEDVLLELGLDSLDIVELQMHYEDKTGVMTETDSRVVTVADMMALMQ